MVKIIYFDYHGVLDRRHFHGMLEVMARTAKAPDPAVFIAQLEPYTYAYASGSVNPESFWTTIANEYGHAVSDAAKKYTLHVDPIRDMWLYLNRLAPRIDLGLFTDCPIDKKQVILHAYDLPTFFDVFLFSCDFGLNKRDATFYRMLAQDGKYRPEECLVIDDQETNIAICQALGFPAWLHRDPQTTIEHIEQVLS